MDQHGTPQLLFRKAFARVSVARCWRRFRAPAMSDTESSADFQTRIEFQTLLGQVCGRTFSADRIAKHQANGQSFEAEPSE